MSFKDFEKALDSLNIVTRITQSELKNQYQKLSKKYHPDMPDGSEEKFREINEAYKIVHTYMKDFRFQLNEEEFNQQNPFSKISPDWYKTFNN
ncbi:DnaJ domain-containing protein [Sulfurimonas sp.]|uniref:DnaJ domain-containing protein n=1 Tax=Sulfurimonas sp. TaxID=2022749 RepID=UPI0035621D9E